MKRILVIEDEPQMQLGLRDNLELEGYEVVPAPSAEAALEALKSEDVDLMLTDKRLPGLDGVRAADARARFAAIDGEAREAYTGVAPRHRD